MKWENLKREIRELYGDLSLEEIMSNFEIRGIIQEIESVLCNYEPTN